MKIASKKELIKFIKKHGFILIGGAKHEKWSNGSYTLLLPRSDKDFSRMMAQRLIKEAGLWEEYQK